MDERMESGVGVEMGLVLNGCLLVGVGTACKIQNKTQGDFHVIRDDRAALECV